MIVFSSKAALSPWLNASACSCTPISNSQFFLLLTANRGNHLLFPAPPRRPPAPICQKQLLVVVVGIERQVARGNRFRLNFQTVPLYLMHREAWFCLYCRYKAIKQNNLTKHVAAARNRPNPAAATTATTFATKTLSIGKAE